MIANRFNPLGAKRRLSAKYYIQEGLIHQYDAIENVGYGEHSNETVVWRDLIGGKDVTLLKVAATVTSIDEFNGKVRWFNDAFEMDGSVDRYSGFSTLGGTEEIPEEFTLEGSLQLDFYRGNSSGNITGICEIYAPNGVVLFRCDGSGSSNIGVYAGEFFDLASVFIGYKKRHTVTFKNNVLKVYVNGNKVIERQYSTTPSFIGRKDYISPIWQAYYGYRGPFRIHNFMVYNRALTDAEVAHNYATDKERFGL